MSTLILSTSWSSLCRSAYFPSDHKPSAQELQDKTREDKYDISMESIWLRLGLFGFWVRLGPLGSVWVRLAPFGSVWVRLDLFGSVLGSGLFWTRLDPVRACFGPIFGLW